MTKHVPNPEDFTSNDRFWAMASSNQPIRREDIGIKSSRTEDGLQTFTEGFDLSRLFNSD